MDMPTLHQLRFIPVVALLGVAAVLLRRPGEPPLALRGVLKMMNGGKKLPNVAKPPAWKRTLAFLCVLAALALALFG